MGKKLVVYEYDSKEYISGYDLELIINIEMGIDSKIGFYEVDEQVINKFKEMGFNIENRNMDLSLAARIREHYYDEDGDSKYRMKIFDYNSLLEWKESMEKSINTPLFKPHIYNLLCEEIRKREHQYDVKDKIVNILSTYIEVLKSEYGADIVNDSLKTIMEIKINSK